MTQDVDVSVARRRFLAACGRFAVATPPAVTLMLAGSGRNYAVASGGGGPPDGVPGRPDGVGQFDGGFNGLNFGATNNCNGPYLNAIIDKNNCKV